MSSALSVISGDIENTRDAFNAVLVDRGMNFEAEAGFALQILQGNEFTAKIAASNRQSLVNAITNVAAIGLSLNPAKKLAYLVPRKVNKVMTVCLDMSYMGLIELATSTGSVMWAQAKLVYRGDSFRLREPGQAPEHNCDPFAKDRGEITGAYAVARLANGDYLVETMSVDEINDIRDRSESYKSGNSSPWKTDWSEMARKTVIKRAYKYWPKTDRMDRAIHSLNTEAGEGLAPAEPPATDFDVDAYIERARGAKTEPELTAIYGEAMQVASRTQDRAGATKFKNAALARRAQIREADNARTIDMPEEKAA